MCQWIKEMGYIFDDDCPLKNECFQYGSCRDCGIDEALKEQILSQIHEIQTIKGIPKGRNHV